jgi:hypothetical protein
LVVVVVTSGSQAVGRVPVILCIDIEPDPRLVSRDAPEPWLGYEATHAAMTALRPRVEAMTRSAVHFNWFLRMDPQIAEPYGSATWIVDTYRQYFHEVERHGDALGIHPHPYRWLAAEQTWLLDYGNQAWVEECLGISLEAFRRAFGRSCQLLRFGDHWLNTATVNLAERLGIECDLTLEPGAAARNTPMPGERTTGSFPDYYRVPRAPYVPSETDFRRPRQTPGRTIRMIPLTAGHLRLGVRPRAHLRRLRAHGLRHWRQSTPLSMWQRWRAPNAFGEMITRALGAQRRPYLALAFRTDTNAEFAAAVDHCLRALLAHPVADRFAFCTPAEALDILKAG